MRRTRASADCTSTVEEEEEEEEARVRLEREAEATRALALCVPHRLLLKPGLLAIPACRGRDQCPWSALVLRRAAAPAAPAAPALRSGLARSEESRRCELGEVEREGAKEPALDDVREWLTLREAVVGGLRKELVLLGPAPVTAADKSVSSWRKASGTRLLLLLLEEGVRGVEAACAGRLAANSVDVLDCCDRNSADSRTS